MILKMLLPLLVSASDPQLKVSLWADDLSLADGSTVASWNQAGQPDAASQPVFHVSGGCNGGSYVQGSVSSCYVGQYLKLPKPLVLNIATNGGITVGAVFRFDEFVSMGYYGWGFDAWAHFLDFKNNGGDTPNLAILRREWSNQLMMSITYANGGGLTVTTQNNVFNIGQWINFIATVSVGADGTVTSASIYIDGIAQPVNPVPQPAPQLTDIVTDQNYIFVPQPPWIATCFAGGSLAALVVYDRFFDSDEAAILSNDLNAGR